MKSTCSCLSTENCIAERYVSSGNVYIYSCTWTASHYRLLFEKFIWFFYPSELNLSGNKLTTLPEELGSLQELQRLDLSCNHLESIPQAVYHCNHLKHLDIQGNSITCKDCFTKKLWFILGVPVKVCSFAFYGSVIGL